MKEYSSKFENISNLPITFNKEYSEFMLEILPKNPF